MQSFTAKYNKSDDTTIIKCGKMQFEMSEIDVKTAKAIIKESKSHQWWVEYLTNKAKPFSLATKNDFLSMSDSVKFFYAAAKKAVDHAVRDGYSIEDAVLIGNYLVDGKETELMTMPLDGRVLDAVKDAMRIKTKGRAA